MEAIIGDRPTLQELSDRVDALEGYPKDGVQIGPGLHVTQEQGRTLRQQDIVEHPTEKGTFAYISDSVVNTRIPEIRTTIQNKINSGTADATETAIHGLPASTELDAGWKT